MAGIFHVTHRLGAILSPTMQVRDPSLHGPPALGAQLEQPVCLRQHQLWFWTCRQTPERGCPEATLGQGGDLESIPLLPHLLDSGR